jgi:pyrrolidone-carboxylate peptidase
VFHNEVNLNSNFFIYFGFFLGNEQVHMGVNGGASKFAIERKAVNEATFRCPDEMGWQPQVIDDQVDMRTSIIFYASF